MTAFDQAFGVVVGHEGGYVHDPRDPGGETQWGISHRAYPSLNIAALTQDDARAIYRRDYWDRVRADDLPPPLALVVFDAAVNAGVGRAVRWLQGALGVPADGAMGPRTIAAARAARVVDVMAEMTAQRLAFMAGLPGWQAFGLGWSRRLCRLPFEAMGMPGGTPGATPGGTSATMEA